MSRQSTQGKITPTRPLPSLEEQRKFWDWHWQHWQERRVLNDWTERRAQEILNLIKEPHLNHPRILDLGCGHGWFTERLANFGDVHGIDLSQEAIAAAKARRPDITYLAGNIYEAPLPANHFDIVVSQEVIAHVEDQPKYLGRAADVLKSRGFLIVTTGNKYVIDRLGDVGWVKQPSEHIRHELGRKQLKDLLAPRFEILKVFTIIPHGMALGVTAYLPEGDRHTYTKDYLESRLAIMMGGRVAEELFLNHITTGAGNDIEQATELARHMVCEFGMSDLGPLAFGKNQQEIFLGRDLATQRDFSEDTAIKIDLEVKKFVMNAYQRAKDVLSSNRETLVRIAEALLVREVLDAADVKLIIEGKPLPERVKPRISAPETTEVLKPQPAAPGLAGRERPQPA